MDKAKQKATVDALSNRKFRIDKVDKDGDYFMSRKRGPTTLYAEVDQDGNVNGGELDAFLKIVKLNRFN